MLKDPIQAAKNEKIYRIIRGSGWNGYQPNLIVSYRGNYLPKFRCGSICLRPVRNVKEKE